MKLLIGKFFVEIDDDTDADEAIDLYMGALSEVTSNLGAKMPALDIDVEDRD